MSELRITSRKNPLLQNVRKLLSSRREREAQGLFAADGTKLLQEAVRWWPGLETVILSDGIEADLPDYVQIYRSVPVHPYSCCRRCSFQEQALCYEYGLSFFPDRHILLHQLKAQQPVFQAMPLRL